MGIRLSYFLLVVLSLLVESVHAQTVDGLSCLQKCRSLLQIEEGGEATTRTSLEALTLKWYFAGFLDGIVITAASPTNGNNVVCLPKSGISPEQTARILEKFLRENPNQLHQSCRILLKIVLAKAFPCQK